MTCGLVGFYVTYVSFRGFGDLFGGGGGRGGQPGPRTGSDIRITMPPLPALYEADDGFVGTAPVGSFAANARGEKVFSDSGKISNLS